MTRPLSSSLPLNGHVQKRARPLLGTLVEISACGNNTHEVASAIDQAFAQIERIQSLMSYHDPASDVSRLNRAGSACMVVDPHTWQVLSRAQDVAQASRGAFDISIAPELVRQGYLPRRAGLSQPATGATWQHIALLSGYRVQLLRPLHLDLGGIAKGYAVDCAVRALREAGMNAGRVNAGGDLRLFGDTAETIHVRHPHSPTRLLPLCALKEGAVATSAPYYAGKQVHGQTLTPLIDAHTRKPCTGSRSVSVLADDCTVADALTKVVYTDPALALAALAHFGAHAVVLDTDPACPGRGRVRMSGADGWCDITPREPEAVAA